MSIFTQRAPQISAMESGARILQFRAPGSRHRFGLCRGTCPSRNDVTHFRTSCAIVGLAGEKMVLRQLCAMRTIVAIMLLCTAFSFGAVRAEPSADTIEHGKQLATAADCAGCHTADPSKPFAGGKRLDTRFGAIYSPNLTPDRETGLGAWSDDDFYSALRFGVARDGSRYYPAFPYPNFTKLTRQDIFAIRAHLATLTPVTNAPRAPELRFPFNYRFVMRVWNWLFFKPGAFEKNPRKSDDWNRGAYLV